MYVDSCCVYYVAWLVGMVGLYGSLLYVLCGVVDGDGWAVLLLCVVCGVVGRDGWASWIVFLCIMWWVGRDGWAVWIVVVCIMWRG
jgi:hypothetical protein